MMHFAGIALLLWAGEAAKPASTSTLETVLKIAPLVPALLAAGYKWAEEHGRERRKANLIEQMAKLAKNIAELPQLPGAGGDATARVRDAFQLELEGSYSELKMLQARAPHRAFGVASVASGMKSVFLFFRPRGFRAWMLHFGFYASLLLLAFLTLGFAVEKSAKHTADTIAQQAQTVDNGGKQPTQGEDSPGIVIAIYVLFGTPPLIFWYFAMKIHRQQCAVQEAARTAVSPSAAPADGA